MKLPAYKDVLRMAKDKITESLAPVRVVRARKQAELEMAKLDEEIATKTAKIHEVCLENEINFGKLIELQDRLALAERKKRQYEKILFEMFPPESGTP